MPANSGDIEGALVLPPSIGIAFFVLGGFLILITILVGTYIYFLRWSSTITTYTPVIPATPDHSCWTHEVQKKITHVTITVYDVTLISNPTIFLEPRDPNDFPIKLLCRRNGPDKAATSATGVLNFPIKLSKYGWVHVTLPISSADAKKSRESWHQHDKSYVKIRLQYFDDGNMCKRTSVIYMPFTDSLISGRVSLD
jgi:hypothetical protein